MQDIQQISASPVRLTVIICTYNRAYILGECLESLKKQTVAHELYEVIVMDNNSTDNTQELVANMAADWPQLKLIHESKQGLSYARNSGAAASKTEWIAYLDSDAKAHPEWVETILAVTAKGDFDAFGGPFYAWHFFWPAPSWFPEDFGSFELSTGYGPLYDEYPVRGNCVLRVSCLNAVGGFPVDLGMKGNKNGYGEESYVFKQMQDNGYRLGYVPELKIDHCVLPYKYSFKWQITSFFNGGRASVRIEEDKHYLLRFVYIWIKNSLRFIKRCCFSGEDRHWKAILLDELEIPVKHVGIIYEKLACLFASKH